MAAPPWLGASPGSLGLAGQVNQFLAAHAINYIYAGASVAAQTTLGSGAVNTNGQYLAQKFTTGSGVTAIGRVTLDLNLTGSPPPVTVSLYADSGGPTGSPLVSTLLPKEFVPGSSTQIFVPLPAAVTPFTTYWIVLSADGDASDFFAWFKSNQVTGAMTSPNGTTWTAQSYGFYFQVFDQTVTTGGLMFTWEDAGARWTELAYNGNGQVSNYAEFTTGQVPTAYTVSSRALSYSGGTLTGVT